MAETEWVIPTLREGMESSDYWRALTEAARAIPEEGEMDPKLALDFWCMWLVDRIRHNFDAVVVITGDEGTGKSTLAIRMALACAKLMKLPWSPKDLCYSAVDLIRAYQTAEKGTPILYDEGVRGTQAGEQMLPEQRAIIKALALVREKKAILFALYPSIWLAAKQVRARRTCLWIHVVRRGLGRVHERDRRLNYLPTDALGLAISPRAPHVAWSAFAENSKTWRDYLKSKSERLDEFLHETERDLKMRAEPKARSVPPTEAEAAARKRAATRERVARWRVRHAGEADGRKNHPRKKVEVDKGPSPEPAKSEEVPTASSGGSA